MLYCVKHHRYFNLWRQGLGKRTTVAVQKITTPGTHSQNNAPPSPQKKLDTMWGFVKLSHLTHNTLPVILTVHISVISFLVLYINDCDTHTAINQNFIYMLHSPELRYILLKVGVSLPNTRFFHTYRYQF